MTNLADTGQPFLQDCPPHCISNGITRIRRYIHALLDGKGSTYQSTCTLLSSLI